MADIKRKRDRSANYTAEDVDNLVEICLRYASVLENKTRDAAINRAKTDAWKYITEEYCARYSPRSTSSLREKYDGVKRYLKKQKLWAKSIRKCTATSPPSKSEKPLSETLKKLAELIPLSAEEVPGREDDQYFVESNDRVCVTPVEVKTERSSDSFCSTSEQLRLDDVTYDEVNTSVPKKVSDDCVEKKDIQINSSITTNSAVSLATQQIPVLPDQTVTALPISLNTSASNTEPIGTSPPIKSTWKNPLTIRGSAFKRRSVTKIPRPATTARRYEELQIAMAQEKHQTALEEMAASQKRAIALHTITLANMRATARREKALNAIKIKVQLEKKRQQRNEYKYRMKILEAELAYKVKLYQALDVNKQSSNIRDKNGCIVPQSQIALQEQPKSIVNEKGSQTTQDLQMQLSVTSRSEATTVSTATSTTTTAIEPVVQL